MRTRGELLTGFLFPSCYKMTSQEEKLIEDEKHAPVCGNIDVIDPDSSQGIRIDWREYRWSGFVSEG